MSAHPGPPPIDPALPQGAEEPSVLPDREGWWEELNSLDLAVYAAVAATPTPLGPRLSPVLPGRRQSAMARQCRSPGDRRRNGRAADQRPCLRRGHLGGCQPAARCSAAGTGLTATQHVPITRQVTMPRSPSFPSGHAPPRPPSPPASPRPGPRPGSRSAPRAMLVAYSRVHTGVHYPVDVIAGDVVDDAGAAHRRRLGRRRLRPRPKS